MLRDLPPDAAERDAALGAGGRRRPAGEGRVAPDVLLGDAAARPGAGQEREVDAELGGDAPHERRRLDALGRRRSGLLGVRRRRLSGRGRLGTGTSPSPMTTSGVPTGTSSPSATRMRATVPAAGEGISTVVLSVWISTSGSSSSIVLADLDEPAGDLALGDPLAEVRQLELVGHEISRPRTLRGGVGHALGRRQVLVLDRPVREGHVVAGHAQDRGPGGRGSPSRR